MANRPKILAVAGVRFYQRSNSGRVFRRTVWLGRDVEGITGGNYKHTVAFRHYST